MPPTGTIFFQYFKVHAVIQREHSHSHRLPIIDGLMVAIAFIPCKKNNINDHAHRKPTKSNQYTEQKIRCESSIEKHRR